MEIHTVWVNKILIPYLIITVSISLFIQNKCCVYVSAQSHTLIIKYMYVIKKFWKCRRFLIFNAQHSNIWILCYLLHCKMFQTALPQNWFQIEKKLLRAFIAIQMRAYSVLSISKSSVQETFQLEISKLCLFWTMKESWKRKSERKEGCEQMKRVNAKDR